mgnify:CR=1 FL=1
MKYFRKKGKNSRQVLIIADSDSIYFIEDGCLRSFSIDKDGKEHTLQFAIKNWWISDFKAIHNNQLTELSLECLKEANIIQITSADFYHALERFTSAKSGVYCGPLRLLANEVFTKTNAAVSFLCHMPILLALYRR